MLRYGIVAFFCALTLSLVSTPQAVELLSQDQALKRMFITADTVIEEKKTFSAAELEKVKGMLGGKLWAMKKPADASEDTYSFFFGMKGGQKTGVAIIEEQEDKWGPLMFIFVLDPANGTITNAAMMKYVDGRVRNMANRAFLKEFFGKGLNDPLTIGTDINAVSGATVSCEILCFIAKKVMALHKVAYGK